MKLSSFRRKVNAISCDKLKPILSILVKKLKATPNFRKPKRKQIKLKIRVVQNTISIKCKKSENMSFDKRRAVQVATMYGTFLNQSGSMTNTQPSATFMNNMNNGFSKFGQPFLVNRRNNNVNTLKGLETSGTNPRWQNLLRNKIAFIDMLMGTGGIKPSRNFSGQATSRVRPSGQTRIPQAPIRPATSIAIPPVDYSKVDVYCKRYSAAYLSGSGGVMDTIASTVASMYNIGVPQAKILLAERCLCNGLTIGSTEPCPPANTNSPFYTTDRFCETDWCVDGQGNPLPNAHPDCECCPTVTGGEFPCDRIPAGICIKFQDAFPAGVNSIAMQGVVNTFQVAANLSNISYSDAYAILLRCCEDGQTGEPCPPANPNSPFYTTDRFCETDWCVDGQGNPLPNAHPDCRCCDDNTGTGSDIPCRYVIAEGICQKYWSHMNNNDAQSAMQEVNQFALNEGISTPAAYALVLKCCGDGVVLQDDFSCERVSQDWCTKFHAAFPFGKNSVNMQGTVNPFIGYASGFGYTLTYDQAYDILLRCCGDGTNIGGNPCEDTNWTNLQAGGTIGEPNYNGGKNNYCDRCSANSQGANFPVIWVNGQWQYDPINGTNYCDCCPTTIDPDIPCGSLNEEEAMCQHHIQSLAGSVILNVNFYQNIAIQLGISNQEAIAYMNRCCGDTTSPCEGFYDVGCCGKCDDTMSPLHTCYDWCQKWGSCCDGDGSNAVASPNTGVTQAPSLPVPTMPTQVQTNNNNNIANPTRGFGGEFMMGD